MLGFASIAEDYAARYHLPLMLSETNIAGTIQEHIAWLRFMELECEEAAPFRSRRPGFLLVSVH